MISRYDISSMWKSTMAASALVQIGGRPVEPRESLANRGLDLRAGIAGSLAGKVRSLAPTWRRRSRSR